MFFKFKLARLNGTIGIAPAQQEIRPTHGYIHGLEVPLEEEEEGGHGVCLREGLKAR